MPQERLQKILAQAGVASRRAAEKMILAGKVTVDGQAVTQLGSKADPAKQSIAVDGKPISRAQAKEYWMLHKPLGVVSTASDPQGRRTVLDMLPPEAAGRLYPVGRLDRDSEGLILLTNDGELANRLMHPRYEAPKHYRVWISGQPTSHTINRLRQGVELDDGPTAPARVYIKSASGRQSKLSFIINEGRNRIIRRMCQAVGHEVSRLVRVAMGPVKLGDLPLGACRRLTMGEIKGLKETAGLITSCKPRSDGVKKSSRRKKAGFNTQTKTGPKPGKGRRRGRN